MATYYDDNYGEWHDMEDGNPDAEDNREFYRQTQADSVWKRCAHCNRKVRIRRAYNICNSCADRVERGGDY